VASMSTSKEFDLTPSEYCQRSHQSPAHPSMVVHKRSSAKKETKSPTPRGTQDRDRDQIRDQDAKDAKALVGSNPAPQPRSGRSRQSDDRGETSTTNPPVLERRGSSAIRNSSSTSVTPPSSLDAAAYKDVAGETICRCVPNVVS
jgi:hypothetical protein